MKKEIIIAFTSHFCDNHSHPVSPESLYLMSPHPRPTRPRVSHLMSSSPSSRVPKSQVPSPHTRVPMSPSPCTQSNFYTQPVQTGPWTHASYSKNGEKTIQCRFTLANNKFGMYHTFSYINFYHYHYTTTTQNFPNCFIFTFLCLYEQHKTKIFFLLL